MPICCDCGKDLPKAGFAKSQLKKKPANRRCLGCAAATGSASEGGGGAAAVAAAVQKEIKTRGAGGGAANAPAAAAAVEQKKELKIPETAGVSTRKMMERGIEVSQSIGGTETAKAVEEFVSQSGAVGRSSEAVEISKPPVPAPAQAPVETKQDAPPKPESPPAAASTSPIPPGLADIMAALTPSQRTLVTSLCSPPANQSHLFSSWPASSTNGDRTAKMNLIKQLESMDQSYPTGGLLGYIANARTLLEKSRRGENPLEGWKPEVPRGEAFEVGTDRWAEVEKRGLQYLGKCGFVLVAGGLGERLGYGDIKVRMQNISVRDI